MLEGVKKLLFFKGEKRPGKAELRKREKIDAEFARVGFRVGEFQAPEKKGSDLNIFLSIALVNFFVVFGAFGGFLSAMEIRWNPFLVAIFLMLAAIALAFFYKYNLYRLLGYLVAFIGILLLLQQNLSLFRTGFAVMANQLMKSLEKVLELPMEREYELYSEHTVLAVNMCAMLIGFVFLLLFNIILSEMQNYWIVIFFSFPIVQLPMYLNKRIPVFYFILYIVGVLSAYCIRSSGHYSIYGKKKKKYQNRTFRKKEYIIYRCDGTSVLGITAILLVLVTVVFASATLLYPRERHQESNPMESVWKTDSRILAKRIALVGFWGMFAGDNKSPNGVTTGKLGQIQRVRPDFEPDLYLYTEQPELESSLYIRNFCGINYEDNSWSIDADANNGDWCVHFQPGDLFMYLDQKYGGYLAKDMKKLMIIESGAPKEYVYIPYWNAGAARNYMETSSGVTETRIGMTGYTNAMYSPLKGDGSLRKLLQQMEQAKSAWPVEVREKFRKMLERYEAQVYVTCLQGNEELLMKIRALCEENGITADLEITEIVERVKTFLANNYNYTLMPGTTPKGKDFAEYFLFEQKKGYCVYFATAATLMFRSLGIPSRYVCGYAASGSDMRNSEKEKISENSALAGMSEIVLTDNDAHAWTEIYLDGFGWWPVEVTNAEELNEEENDIAGFLAGLFGAETVEYVKRITITLGTRLLLLLISALIGYLITTALFRSIHMQEFRKCKNDRMLIELYRHLVKMMKASKIKTGSNTTCRENAVLLSERLKIETEEIYSAFAVVDKIRFSSHTVSKEERDDAKEKMLVYEKKLCKSAGLCRLFLIRWIYRL